MTLQKYTPPTITPAQGGFTRVGTIDGLPGHDPQRLGGFYPTGKYAAVRTFVNGSGDIEQYPDGYPNYRLPYDLLSPVPPDIAEATRIVENWLRGEFDAARPYVYLQADFNVWDSRRQQPAVTPVPEEFAQYLPNGWGAGAITSDVFVRSGRLTFTTTAGTYGVVGIAGPTGDPTDPNSVEFGFLFRQALPAAVLESGVEYALSGAHYASSTFAIQYNNGVVDYLVDGVSRRTTTSTPTAKTYSGIACLYSGTSRIGEATLVSYTGAAMTLPALRKLEKRAELTLPALRGSAGWNPYAALTAPAMRGVGGNAPYAHATMSLRAVTMTGGTLPPVATLPRLTMMGGQGNIGAVRLPKISVVAGVPLASGAQRLPAMRASGYAGRPRPLGAMAVMPRMRAIATGQTTTTGGAALSMPALRGRSAYYASAAVTLPRAQVFGFDESQDEAFISGVPYSSAPAETDLLVVVTIDFGGNIASVGTAQLVLNDEVLGTVEVTATEATQMLLNAMMNATLLGASFTPMSEQGGETWVVNADTGASSSYESYAFNSFANVGGQMFGARSDGLYLMEGDTDAGVPIRASLAFGSTDFKTRHLKRPEHAYIGVASSGTMYLKVIVQGKEYVYAARRSDDYMAVQRIDIGRGIRASYLAFELYNSDGCDFELNTVSFYAAELTRSI